MKEIEETYIFHSAFLLRSHFRTKATFGRRCQSEEFQPPFASGARAWKKKHSKPREKKTKNQMSKRVNGPKSLLIEGLKDHKR